MVNGLTMRKQRFFSTSLSLSLWDGDCSLQNLNWNNNLKGSETWWRSYCFSISACNRTCKTCSSSTACLTCRNGLILNRNGHCVLSGHCSRTEYYDEKTETCKTCHKKCFHCSGPTEHQCISCANNRYLFSKCLSPVYRLYSTLAAWNKQAYVTFIKHLGLL